MSNLAYRTYNIESMKNEFNVKIDSVNTKIDSVKSELTNKIENSKEFA
ncbi:hypothetical protein QIA17_05855 (plasmid) [Borreliella californiensis]|uniref:Uncharacterized protein n=1 Tax=Borreliella californiensis TaxID=373543 RepID=A0A7X0DQ41_9SPIR|nr:hypothetical protein [Borreliella californiensis]MBB6213720.1 hypothetical protein [Borreliella californiensis]